MSKNAVSVRQTDPNIVFLHLKPEPQERPPSDPLQLSVTGEKLLATSATAERLQELYLAYGQILIARTLEVVEGLWTKIPDSSLGDVPTVFYFPDAEAKQLSTQDLVQARLKSSLLSSFEADPLEDGMYHPAEEIIAEALWSEEDQHVFRWLNALCLDAAYPSFAASVLRCLGRQTSPGTGSWRAELVRSGLTIDDVEIRDAAVQAAESWGDLELINVLESHSDPESWLQDYVRAVIDHLKR